MPKIPCSSHKKLKMKILIYRYLIKFADISWYWQELVAGTIHLFQIDKYKIYVFWGLAGGVLIRCWHFFSFSEMMQESKLTNFQQRYLEKQLRGEDKFLKQLWKTDAWINQLLIYSKWQITEPLKVNWSWRLTFSVPYDPKSVSENSVSGQLVENKQFYFINHRVIPHIST